VAVDSIVAITIADIATVAFIGLGLS